MKAEQYDKIVKETEDAYKKSIEWEKEVKELKIDEDILKEVEESIELVKNNLNLIGANIQGEKLKNWNELEQ